VETARVCSPLSDVDVLSHHITVLLLVSLIELERNLNFPIVSHK
jgi:hypothetical protein